MRDLVPFVQLTKRDQNPWRKYTFSKVYSSMDQFQIVQMVPDRANHHI